MARRGRTRGGCGARVLLLAVMLVGALPGYTASQDDDLGALPDICAECDWDHGDPNQGSAYYCAERVPTYRSDGVRRCKSMPTYPVPFTQHTGFCEGRYVACYDDRGVDPYPDDLPSDAPLGARLNCNGNYPDGADENDALLCLDASSLSRSCLLPNPSPDSPNTLPTRYSCPSHTSLIRAAPILAARVRTVYFDNYATADEWRYAVAADLARLFRVDERWIKLGHICPASQCPISEYGPQLGLCSSRQARERQGSCVHPHSCIALERPRSWLESDIKRLQSNAIIDFDISNVAMGRKLNLFSAAIDDLMSGNLTSDSPLVQLGVQELVMTHAPIWSWKSLYETPTPFPSTATGIIILILFMTLFLFIVVVMLHNRSNADRKKPGTGSRAAQQDQMEAGFISNEMKVIDAKRGARMKDGKEEVPGAALGGAGGGVSTTARIMKWRENCTPPPKDRDPDVPLGGSCSDIATEAAAASEGKRWWDANSNKVIVTTDSVSCDSDIPLADGSVPKEKSPLLDVSVGAALDAGMTPTRLKQSLKSDKPDKIAPPRARGSNPNTSLATKPNPDELLDAEDREKEKDEMNTSRSKSRKKGSLRSSPDGAAAPVQASVQP